MAEEKTIVNASRFALDITTPHFRSRQEAEEAANSLNATMLRMGFPSPAAIKITDHEESHALGDKLVLSGEEEGWITVRVLGLKISRHFYPVTASARYNYTGERTEQEVEQIVLAVPNPSNGDIGTLLRCKGYTLGNIITGRRPKH